MKSYLHTICATFILSLLILAPTSVQAQGVAMFAVLVGGNEVSPAGLANAGDPDGFGTISIIVNPTPAAATEQLCFGMAVRGIDAPTAAHIHVGSAGVNGDIVVPLVPAPAAGNPGTSSNCVNAGNGVVNFLILRPARFYVNVHTGAFPAGALRGQFF
ncbi:MAG: CHRD domain-containing protein [Methylococcales bacterium]